MNNYFVSDLNTKLSDDFKRLGIQCTSHMDFHRAFIDLFEALHSLYGHWSTMDKLDENKISNNYIIKILGFSPSLDSS